VNSADRAAGPVTLATDAARGNHIGWTGTDQEARVSDVEPIAWRGAAAADQRPETHRAPAVPPDISFDRRELREILNVYGRKVAAGEWRDYAIDSSRDRAVFSVFRRASEYPIYRIEKNPRLARKQGLYAVLAAGGLVLKRGHELAHVLSVLEKRLRLVR
jgi:hypothetical protein